MFELRLSLKFVSRSTSQVIVCLCRGVSDRAVVKAIDDGASSLRDLRRCGIGDQCGTCNSMLRAMLNRAAETRTVQAQACPTCGSHQAPAVSAGVSAAL